jgi:hypothetical protein
MLNNQRVQMKYIIPSITQLYVEKKCEKLSKNNPWLLAFPYSIHGGAT